MKKVVASLIVVVVAVAVACSISDPEPPTAADLPPMRWGSGESQLAWQESALEALQSHASVLPQSVPADITEWCPYYPEADTFTREAFWIGFLSALAKHESTYKPEAVGGNGRWYGLVQISPATARGYGCRAGSGNALKDGGENLSCALRIMSVTVPRDGLIHANDGKWRGVAADWGPIRVGSKRRDISGWLKKQPFCKSSVMPE